MGCGIRQSVGHRLSGVTAGMAKQNQLTDRGMDLLRELDEIKSDSMTAVRWEQTNEALRRLSSVVEKLVLNDEPLWEKVDR